MQFWNAAAAAVALNRTLILPQFTCYCDELWYWSLEVNPAYKCRYVGARNQTLPFQCPHDMVVNLLQLDDAPAKFGAAVKYRESTFMDNSRTPQAIKVSGYSCDCCWNSHRLRGTRVVWPFPYGVSLGSLCDTCLGFVMCRLLYKLHTFNPTSCLCNTFACSELMSTHLNLSEFEFDSATHQEAQGKEDIVETICSIAQCISLQSETCTGHESSPWSAKDSPAWLAEYSPDLFGSAG